eukprot:scaffold1255_cov120-Isochrysis_galbana.AAC.8
MCSAPLAPASEPGVRGLPAARLGAPPTCRAYDCSANWPMVVEQWPARVQSCLPRMEVRFSMAALRDQFASSEV